MVVNPKFASSVILYRLKNSINKSNQCNFEVFLIQRAKSMRFLGGVHAFPGGKLEEDDYSDINITRCKGLDKFKAHQLILDKKTYHDNENYSLGFWIAGIREIFEEIGLLFAYNKEINLINLIDQKYKEKFDIYREKLIADQIILSEIMLKEDLYYAIDRLYYFKHFITPEISPIRYDTRFFLAEMPPNQLLKPDSTEIISAEWCCPTDAIKRYRKKQIILIPPQYSCLSNLCKIVDIGDFCSSLS